MNVCCKNLRILGLLAVAFTLIMYFASIATATNIPIGTIIHIPDGKSVHFSTTVYVSTSGTAMHIQEFFIDNTFNYTVDSDGTQLIHNGSEPTAVYINGLLGSEGSDWTYSSGTIIVYTATMSVSIFYGPAPTIPPGPESPAAALEIPLSALVYGQNFSIQLTEGSSIGFQGDAILTLTALSTGLHCLNCNVTTYSNTGYLDMQPQTDLMFTISTSTNDVYVDLTGSGASLVSSGNATWSASMLAGNSYRLIWGWTIPSILDTYVRIGLGLAGIGLMVFGPSWVAWRIKEHGFDGIAMQRLFYLLILFFIGLGLFFMWVIT